MSEMSQSSGDANSITVPRSAKRPRPEADPLKGFAKFAPSATEWCFTFNNYLPEDPDRLIDAFNRLGAQYVFQREIAESGTHHLQGVVRSSKSINPLEIFPKSYPNWKGIHWERCRSWEHSIRYCSKEDTRKPDTEIYCNTLILATPVIRGWQKVLVDDLLPSFVHRNVYWFWEFTGGVGKSMLVRYLCMTRKALVVSGKDADMKCGCAEYVEKTGAGPEIIIVDCPRSSVGFVNYGGIEQVANGCFFSSKYNSAMVIMDYPIILCFANEEPNYIRMSMDRWQVYNIDIEKQDLIMRAAH